MTYTLLDLAESFLSYHELPGAPAEPLIIAMLQSVDHGQMSDEIAWCSAFVNFCAQRFQHFAVPRSNSLAARSWLGVGQTVDLSAAAAGWDVVIFRRGADPQPAPDIVYREPTGLGVRYPPGHVAFYVSHNSDTVTVLGGNQGNKVSLATFPIRQVLGVRRLYTDALTASATDRRPS